MSDLSGFKDPIFRGCTRPAMLAKVPMLPIVMLSLACMLVGVWAAFLISALCLIPIIILWGAVYAWMRKITAKDDQALRQMMMRMSIRIKQTASRRIYGVVTYSPIRYKRR